MSLGAIWDCGWWNEGLLIPPAVALVGLGINLVSAHDALREYLEADAVLEPVSRPECLLELAVMLALNPDSVVLEGHHSYGAVVHRNEVKELIMGVGTLMNLERDLDEIGSTIDQLVDVVLERLEMGHRRLQMCRH